MASLLSDTTLPLTLSEQLNAMLSGWLDRHAPDGDLGDPRQRAAAVITVANSQVAQVEEFCAGWSMTVRRVPHSDARWAAVVVEGAALPVRGFTEITAMYRR